MAEKSQNNTNRRRGGEEVHAGTLAPSAKSQSVPGWEVWWDLRTQSVPALTREALILCSDHT